MFLKNKRIFIIMKKQLFAACLLISSFSVAFAQNLSGTWEGVITQDKGGILDNYTFKIYMQVKKDGLVKGTAYVRADEFDIYAFMQFKGTFDGTYIRIEEDEILRQKVKDEISWCIKDYKLKLISSDKLRLEGKWRGYAKTGACVPGEIYLTKSEPRA